jgi:HK97 family phage portal protein
MTVLGRIGKVAVGLARVLRGGASKALAPVDGSRGWWPLIREFTAGAWQSNLTVTLEDSLGYWVQFRCISMISSDVAKCRIKLVEQDGDAIWNETDSAAFSPVLRKPNHYQNRIQFVESWMQSKLSRGNAVVLKVRDARGVVIALYVLDWALVRPMVADDGSVFYELRKDKLSGLDGEALMVPASEIIHDRWNTLYHPLVGLSPVYANGVVALMGTRMLNNSARFFANGARPSGVLVAPGAISETTAQSLKEYWNENFTGEKAGKVAVLGDGLKYEQMTMSAVDAQLIEQLKWGDATIAGSYGVPAYMVNAGTPPAYNNVEALAQQYYSQCLQIHIESIELCLDEGLGLTAVQGKTYGTEFDLDDLLRMDSATQIKTLTEGLKGLYASNEARKKMNLPPKRGGDAVLSQQQNFSLEALAKRDAKDDPFKSAAPPRKPANGGGSGDEEAEQEEQEELTESESALAAWELKSRLARLDRIAA